MTKKKTIFSVDDVLAAALKRASELDRRDDEAAASLRDGRPDPDEDMKRSLRAALEKLGVSFEEFDKPSDAPVTDGAEAGKAVVIPLEERRKASEGWRPVRATDALEQRLAARHAPGLRGWSSIALRDEEGLTAELRVLFRDNDTVRLVRDDSGEGVVGVFTAAGELVGELKRKHDEALLSGVGRRRALDLAGCLRLRARADEQ